jgi:acetyl esterase/lipase
MKPLLLTLCILSAFAALRSQQPSQQPVWQPSPGHTQIPIWPGKVPDARPAKGPETAETDTDPKNFIAGKPATAIKNVSRPTMTVYSPTGKNTGAAVVVFPGGGYEILAIDLEGTEVCDWLVPRGITCVLLSSPGCK